MKYFNSHEMRVFLCHDYLPENRSKYCCESSVHAQKQQNIHIHVDTKKKILLQCELSVTQIWLCQN